MDIREKQHGGMLYLPGDESLQREQLRCLDLLHEFNQIGPNVVLAGTGHPICPELRERGYQYTAPVRIGRNCWLGANMVVVPHDLPDNVIAVGNPCKILREVNDHDREYYFRDRKIDPKL